MTKGSRTKKVLLLMAGPLRSLPPPRAKCPPPVEGWNLPKKIIFSLMIPTLNGPAIKKTFFAASLRLYAIQMFIGWDGNYFSRLVQYVYFVHINLENYLYYQTKGRRQ